MPWPGVLLPPSAGKPTRSFAGHFARIVAEADHVHCDECQYGEQVHKQEQAGWTSPSDSRGPSRCASDAHPGSTRRTGEPTRPTSAAVPRFAWPGRRTGHTRSEPCEVGLGRIQCCLRFLDSPFDFVVGHLEPDSSAFARSARATSRVRLAISIWSGTSQLKLPTKVFGAEESDGGAHQDEAGDARLG